MDAAFVPDVDVSEKSKANSFTSIDATLRKNALGVVTESVVRLSNGRENIHRAASYLCEDDCLAFGCLRRQPHVDVAEVVVQPDDACIRQVERHGVIVLFAYTLQTYDKTEGFKIDEIPAERFAVPLIYRIPCDSDRNSVVCACHSSRNCFASFIAGGAWVGNVVNVGRYALPR